MRRTLFLFLQTLTVYSGAIFCTAREDSSVFPASPTTTTVKTAFAQSAAQAEAQSITPPPAPFSTQPPLQLPPVQSAAQLPQWGGRAGQLLTIRLVVQSQAPHVLSVNVYEC